jgi:hypothetical protein
MARVHGAHTTVHHTPPHLACALLRVVARPPCYCTYYTTGGLPRVLLSATYYLLLTTYYTAGGLPRACHLRSHLSAARMCQGLGLRRRLRPLARTHALLRRRPLLLRPVRGRPYTHITYAYMCVYACTRSRGINARCGAYTPCDVPGRAGAGRPLHPPAQRGTPCSRATELQCAAALRVGLLSYSLRPNTTCYSSRTAHCSLLTTSLLTVLTAHHSPYSLLATPYSLPTTHHSPLTTHHSHHSPLTTHHSPLTTQMGRPRRRLRLRVRARGYGGPRAARCLHRGSRAARDSVAAAQRVTWLGARRRRHGVVCGGGAARSRPLTGARARGRGRRKCRTTRRRRCAGEATQRHQHTHRRRCRAATQLIAIAGAIVELAAQCHSRPQPQLDAQLDP